MHHRELFQRLADDFAREGVDPSYVHFVSQHVDVPDDEWRTCCNSACDPCVVRLGRLVDAARALIHGNDAEATAEPE